MQIWDRTVVFTPAEATWTEDIAISHDTYPCIEFGNEIAAARQALDDPSLDADVDKQHDNIVEVDFNDDRHHWLARVTIEDYLRLRREARDYEEMQFRELEADLDATNPGDAAASYLLEQWHDLNRGRPEAARLPFEIVAEEDRKRLVQVSQELVVVQGIMRTLATRPVQAYQ